MHFHFMLPVTLTVHTSQRQRDRCIQSQQLTSVSSNRQRGFSQADPAHTTHNIQSFSLSFYVFSSNPSVTHTSYNHSLSHSTSSLPIHQSRTHHTIILSLILPIHQSHAPYNHSLSHSTSSLPIHQSHTPYNHSLSQSTSSLPIHQSYTHTVQSFSLSYYDFSSNPSVIT